MTQCRHEHPGGALRTESALWRHDEQDIRINLEQHSTARGPALLIQIAGDLDLHGVDQLHAGLPAELKELLRPTSSPRAIPSRPGRPQTRPAVRCVTGSPGADLERPLDPWPALIVIDLAAVPFLDSSGVGVLLTFYRRLSDQGLAFSVCCAQPQPHQVLTLTATDKIVDVRATRSEALT